MPIKKELSVVLPNRPGTMAELASTLAKAKVNLLAIDASGGFEYNIVRLVPDRTAKAKAVIKRLGLDVEILLAVENSTGSEKNLPMYHLNKDVIHIAAVTANYGIWPIW